MNIVVCANAVIDNLPILGAVIRLNQSSCIALSQDMQQSLLITLVVVATLAAVAGAVIAYLAIRAWVRWVAYKWLCLRFGSPDRHSEGKG